MPDLFAPSATAVVLNPISGKPSSRRKARRMADQLTARGYRIVPTTGPNSAGRLAREAVECGCNSVIAIGGDGTLYETMAELPAETGIGFFPTGTVNLFARGLNIPLRPDAWLELLDSRHTVPMHLGRCNNRPFACVASVGFDALVVAKVNRTLKKWIQKGAYAVAALRSFAGYAPPDLSVTLDGEPYRPRAEFSRQKLVGVIVARVPYYGGLHAVLPKADPLSPRLEVALLHAQDKWSLLRFARGVVLGTLPRMKGVVYQTVQRIRIESQPASEVELDGDAFSQTPVECRVEPNTRPILSPGW